MAFSDKHDGYSQKAQWARGHFLFFLSALLCGPGLIHRWKALLLFLDRDVSKQSESLNENRNIHACIHIIQYYWLDCKVYLSIDDWLIGIDWLRCVWVICGGQRTTLWVSFFLPPWDSRGKIQVTRLVKQALFPAEPSHSPALFYSSSQHSKSIDFTQGTSFGCRDRDRIWMSNQYSHLNEQGDEIHRVMWTKWGVHKGFHKKLGDWPRLKQ